MSQAVSPLEDTPSVREGKDLLRATRAYSKEDPAVTWVLFGLTVAVYLSAVAVAMFAPVWPVQIIGSVVAGLTVVRLFIFFHDYLHGAIFRGGSKAGQFAMTLVGLYTLNPPSVWKETHNYHHANNAKMTGAAIGSYPVVTTRMWRRMTDSQKRWYKFARHPLTIVFGYFTTFIGGMCISAFIRQPKMHWQAPLALLFHFGLIFGTYATLGFWAAFWGIFFPAYLACMLGGYLFYVQHNFPDCELRDRTTWTFESAALKSSSMFDMNPVLHWFTGNIGYHHIHHLNHKIPFYNLPKAYAEIPELQQVGRTSWAPSDIVTCLNLKVWDSKNKRLAGWDALPSK